MRPQYEAQFQNRADPLQIAPTRVEGLDQNINSYSIRCVSGEISYRIAAFRRGLSMTTEGIDKEYWMFASGCAADRSPQAAFCALHCKPLAAIGGQMSSFALYREGTWFSTELMPEWNAIAMAAVEAVPATSWTIFALGEGGQIWEYDVTNKRDSISQLPRSFGMTNLAAISGSLFACGMGRVVLQRQVDGSWTDLSAPWPDRSVRVAYPVMGVSQGRQR
jgi:hypothetical protein